MAFYVLIKKQFTDLLQWTNYVHNGVLTCCRYCDANSAIFSMS